MVILGQIKLLLVSFIGHFNMKFKFPFLYESLCKSLIIRVSKFLARRALKGFRDEHSRLSELRFELIFGLRASCTPFGFILQFRLGLVNVQIYRVEYWIILTVILKELNSLTPDLSISTHMLFNGTVTNRRMRPDNRLFLLYSLHFIDVFLYI